MTASLRLVVFDFDGTILDSLERIVSCMNHAFARAGLPQPSEEAVRGIIGRTLEDAMTDLAPGCDPVEMTAYYREGHNMIAERGELDRAPLYPRVAEALDVIDDDRTIISIATGKRLLGLRDDLQRNGLKDRFYGLHTPDHAPSKPAPDMLFQAIEKAGIEASRTIMIGDSIHDINMANNAGVKSIGVSWGYHSVPMLKAAGAQAIADDWRDLPAIIDELLP